MKADDDRARIIRLEGEIAYLRERMTAPAPAQRGTSLLNFIGSLVLIAICLFGLWALIHDNAGGFAGTPETTFSTPAALPTAALAPNAPAARTAPYTHIVEATFPPPIPAAAPAVAEPAPWPADDGAAAQAATAEQQGFIDRWLNGPPSTATPTTWPDFVQSFATPEPCNQFIGRVGAARAACATPEE